MTTNHLFTELGRELSLRTARASLSYLSPRSVALRRHLQERFERGPGEPGGFLASPVIEALFPWQSHHERMRDLDFLDAQLLRNMDAPPKALEDERFGRDWFPHRHQAEAWRILDQETPQSVLVSSGTSSGKTECFLVPILNDLARELRTADEPLVGTRALFLYPLNALINSQRDRLRAWSHGFGNRLRFCLYNGNTPKRRVAQQLRDEHPEEVFTRRELYQAPPPIVVTNATMLEYMLVRLEDRPILEQSRGKLRWIVLDEAHTYVGSQAAEIALLLRRVLDGFGVEPQDVRFVATSATIGGKEEGERLREFLCQLSGQLSEQVHVVTGHRDPPKLEGVDPSLAPLPDDQDLQSQTPAERFATLTASPSMMGLRQALIEGPKRLDELAECFDPKPSSSQLLTAVDLATSATESEKATPFLPARSHFFLRTQGGLWACCNPECSGRTDQELGSPGDWRFGAVFGERRTTCSYCDSLVFDLVACNTCGAESLAAQLQGERTLEAADWIDEDDEEDSFAPDDDDPGQMRTEGASRYLLLNHLRKEDHGLLRRLDPQTGVVDGPEGLPVPLLAESGGRRLDCRTCGSAETESRSLIRPARMGAPFHLGVAIPTILEALPVDADAGGRELPFQGRRVITFNDSRQGTARVAARTQLAAERNYTRSAIYHQLLAMREAGDPNEVAKLEDEVSKLEGVPGLESLLETQKDKLRREKEKLESPKAHLPWPEMRKLLGQDSTVRRTIRDLLIDRYPPAADELQESDVASLLL